MRYSDLDILSHITTGIPSGRMEEHDDKGTKVFDVNYNEQTVSDILDNCSISDEECSTERSDDSLNNKKTEDIKIKSKPKKRVMFKCGDNLVMIREIPPREPTSDSDTSEESYSDSESDESDTESDESDHSVNKNKVSTEVKPIKKLNSRVAKIIREAPIVLKPKEQPAKRPQKKRLAKRVRRENVSKEESQSKNTEKISIKPRQIQLKTPDKDVSKVNENKLCKSNIKRKKISINRMESPTPKGTLDCKNSKIILAERLKGKPPKSLLEKRERKIESPRLLINSENSVEDCVISDISQSFNQRPLSQKDKRLYSWLLANGRIPGPEQQSPCISPMWDTKQSAFTAWDNKQVGISDRSVVKAPT